MSQPDSHPEQDPVDLPYDSTLGGAGRRGTDDRRETVNPAENPAPTSPEPDEEALRKAEDVLERVKPY